VPTPLGFHAHSKLMCSLLSPGGPCSSDAATCPGTNSNNSQAETANRLYCISIMCSTATKQSYSKTPCAVIHVRCGSLFFTAGLLHNAALPAIILWFMLPAAPHLAPQAKCKTCGPYCNTHHDNPCRKHAKAPLAKHPFLQLPCVLWTHCMQSSVNCTSLVNQLQLHKS
jgi:hypothetical protein